MRVIKARVAAFWWMGLMAALIPVAVCAQPTSTGEIAREFSVVGFDDGKVIRMSDFDGQILILDFFAYWCIHCRASAPDLEANVREYYENRGGNIDGIPVTVLSISIESREPPKTAAFIEEHGVALAANDFEGTGSDAWQQFGAAAIPHFVIINGVADSATHQQ